MVLKSLNIMYPRNYILTDITVTFPLLNHRYKVFGVLAPIAKLKDLTLSFQIIIRNGKLYYYYFYFSVHKLAIPIYCYDDLCYMLYLHSPNSVFT